MFFSDPDDIGLFECYGSLLRVLFFLFFFLKSYEFNENNNNKEKKLIWVQLSSTVSTNLMCTIHVFFGQIPLLLDLSEPNFSYDPNAVRVLEGESFYLLLFSSLYYSPCSHVLRRINRTKFNHTERRVIFTLLWLGWRILKHTKRWKMFRIQYTVVLHFGWILGLSVRGLEANQ